MVSPVPIEGLQMTSKRMIVNQDLRVCWRSLLAVTVQPWAARWKRYAGRRGKDFERTVRTGTT